MPYETRDQAREERARIIAKHARMQTGSRAGKPQFCEPTAGQVTAAAAKGHPAQRRPPIIFPSVEAAQRCAQELASAGFTLMSVYACERSKNGHAHLSGH